MPNPTITYRSATPGALLSVTEVGKQTVRSLIVDRTLALFAAVLVEAGEGTIETLPSGRLAVVAPTLFWLVPGVPHTYGPLAATAWEERWVLFKGPLAEQLLSRRLIDPRTPAVSLPANSDLPHLFRELHTELLMRSDLGDSAAAATLGRIVTRAAVEAELRLPRGPHRDADMIATLRQRALSPIDFVALAREFGVSPATLRRRFIATTGLPPKVLQLRMRIDRAKELLATTEGSIEHVATAVGFDDSFYFARLFLQREKLTPTEFRRLNHRH